MDVYPKFIIEDGNLIISKCTYHKELAENIENVKGGGMYYISNGVCRLYGHSHDFGPPKLEDIKKAIEKRQVFSDKYLITNITDRFKFEFDIGTEIIKLN